MAGIATGLLQLVLSVFWLRVSVREKCCFWVEMLFWVEGLRWKRISAELSG